MHAKEPIDAAEERLAALMAQIPTFDSTLKSEADVRSKVIDPIFGDVLGWPKHEIHLEAQAGEGFIDYRCTIDGLNKLIVEAKKDGRDFAIAREKNGRHYKLSGPVFRNSHVAEGIDQGIRYCGRKNAELACVTNGRQWVVFRGNRGGDGHDTTEGYAFVFSSLEGVREKFSLFYDLLAYEHVGDHTYRGHFQNAEGKSEHVRRKRYNVRKPESRVPVQGDRLSGDLDRVLRLLLRDISGDENREARRFCFVTTPESERAEAKLARVSEDLRNAIRSLDTKDGEEITDAIRRVQESRLRECVLLVGTKGSGKSTFIERFFEDILTKSIRDDCLIASIDLANCEGDESTLVQWLDRHCLETVEKAMFPNGPSYDDLRGIYWSEYGRWREGEHKPLYDQNRDEFRIRFGDYMFERREKEPHEYIEHLLTDAVKKRKKVPCLVFDNADHFNVPFQERVFQYAHSLFKNSVCLVIVPITDTTSWQLPRQGPLQSFYTDSYYLPTPPVEVVLQKRIAYLEDKLRDQKPEPGRGYLFGEHGYELEIGNLKAFAATLHSVFLRTGHVAEWIGALVNYDIRRCLHLARDIISSPYLRVNDLLKACTEGTSTEVDSEDIRLALIKGKYDLYPVGQNDFVQNVFSIGTEIESSPLLAVRTLTYLEECSAKEDDQPQYIDVSTVVDYLTAMNINAQDAFSCVEWLVSVGLVMNYDPTAKKVKDAHRVRISASGSQHLRWAQKDWIYLWSMAEITPIFDQDVCSAIRADLEPQQVHLRRSAIERFIAYVVAEDKRVCLIPAHSRYAGQAQIRKTYELEIDVLRRPTTVPQSQRFCRTFGRITKWVPDKGFGFIRPNAGGEDVFVHVTEIVDARGAHPADGTEVEYELNAEGKAHAVLILNRTR